MAAYLPSEVLLLKVSQYSVRGSSEAKGQLEANISAVCCTAKLPNRSSEPDLSHAEEGTHDTKAESNHGCDSRGKFVLVHVDAWIIAGHATLVEDVL